MLDIYFNEAEDGILKMPEYPDENRIIGSLGLDRHKRLAHLFERCELQGVRFPYFEDSLLSFEQIKIMDKIFDDSFAEMAASAPQTLDAYETFRKIIARAIFAKAGIVSFCD